MQYHLEVTSKVMVTFSLLVVFYNRTLSNISFYVNALTEKNFLLILISPILNKTVQNSFILNNHTQYSVRPPSAIRACFYALLKNYKNITPLRCIVVNFGIVRYPTSCVYSLEFPMSLSPKFLVEIF